MTNRALVCYVLRDVCEDYVSYHITETEAPLITGLNAPVTLLYYKVEAANSNRLTDIPLIIQMFHGQIHLQFRGIF